MALQYAPIVLGESGGLASYRRNLKACVDAPEIFGLHEESKAALELVLELNALAEMQANIDTINAHKVVPEGVSEFINSLMLPDLETCFRRLPDSRSSRPHSDGGPDLGSP